MIGCFTFRTDISSISVHLARSANVYLVPDVAKAKLCKIWSVVMTGGGIISPEYLKSLGKEGPSIWYLPAMRTERCIWVSDAFKAAHSQLLGVLVHNLSTLIGNKWVVVHDRQRFIERVRTNPKNTSRFIALLTTPERDATQQVLCAII